MYEHSHIKLLDQYGTGEGDGVVWLTTLNLFINIDWVKVVLRNECICAESICDIAIGTPIAL